jgi:predicted metalloendopeptidase
VIIFSKDYFSKLTKLINDYNSTESGRFTLNFFVYFHTMKLSLPLLSSEFRYQLTILTNLLGIGNVERWRQCIELVDDIFGFGHAVGRLFVRKTFQNSKQNVLELISRIKKSLKNSFNNLSWMDDETRKVASEKVDYVTELIGYPDFIMNDRELDKIYEIVDIDMDDLFGNVIKIKKFSLKNEINSFRKPVKKTE